VRRVAPIALIAVAGCGGSGGSADTTTTPTPTSPPARTATTTQQATTPKSKPQPKPRAPRTPQRSLGIGDQNATMFAAPLFRRLHVRIARRVFPWDAMRLPTERALADQWLGAAKAAGVEPFVTFGASREHPEELPTVAQFRDAFNAFRKRYPQVRVYAPWNEANHRSQPTYDHPDRAAAYYDVVHAWCPGCTVVAADVLDQAGFERWLQRFRAATKSHPQLWGLHNYSDTNRFRTRGTRAMLRTVPGDIWVTETGGVARFGRSFPFDLRRQARATAFTFRLLELSPRLRRLYLYNWTGAPPDARFDAGLTNVDGSARPAYHVVARKLQ
jgi:hypothetical protein